MNTSQDLDGSLSLGTLFKMDFWDWFWLFIFFGTIGFCVNWVKDKFEELEGISRSAHGRISELEDTVETLEDEVKKLKRKK